ncbi:V-type ATPase [Catenaria anguillulae PL171]|uniref:V-type proton ATPase proteolipid subunit n=1 Tax=Catenaria anguillulae PL171 TaxID=765915 RepID=A0A1Y2HFI3_9FUNG|nr:V-type ATPase [Catenaria anguillulae PL171]
MSAQCPIYASFFGLAGSSMAMILTAIGAAYGTYKAGVGIAMMGTFRPDLIMKSLIPVVMAGIIAVYGLVVAVVISGNMSPANPYSLFSGLLHLAAGLSVGFTGIAAGYAVGVVGDAGVKGYSMSPRLFVGMVLMLIFAEVLGLYGLIVALILNTRATNDC